MYDWSSTMRMATKLPQQVSVVVERMYDWSSHSVSGIPVKRGFSCCWKDVRLKQQRANRLQFLPLLVSVVVERMYDWSSAAVVGLFLSNLSFSCCWKDVRLKPKSGSECSTSRSVSVVVERMYDWSSVYNCLCSALSQVSVVVERMYDWSHRP